MYIIFDVCMYVQYVYIPTESFLHRIFMLSTTTCPMYLYFSILYTYWWYIRHIIYLTERRRSRLVAFLIFLKVHVRMYVWHVCQGQVHYSQPVRKKRAEGVDDCTMNTNHITVCCTVAYQQQPTMQQYQNTKDRLGGTIRNRIGEE